MAQLLLNNTSFSSQLYEIMQAEDLEPGSDVSYQIAKILFAYHPLGQKMAKAPVDLAQSQEREITVPDGPEDRVVKAFRDEWKKLEADRFINNVRVLSRIYGIASLAVLIDGQKPAAPMDYWKLWEQTIAFNVLDPLNTAGSLVLNQNPNSLDFMKWDSIRIAGTPYHRNRSVTILNEEPIYIEYTTSAFGFVGRSVYQRALYPLKSFLQTMVTDDMISRKAGVLIAKVKQPGSIIDNMMAMVGGLKRAILQQAQTNNVIQVDVDETIESLDLQNIDGAGTFSRRNIVTNIATAADMPAVMLLNETLTEGFGEGTEDAKQIARYIERERMVMGPLYTFMDRIAQHRAWNPEFYAIIQKDFPEEYGGMEYKEAFFRWQNSFAAVWPNLLAEPDSEKIKTQDVVFKACIATAEVMLANPQIDPENKIRVMEWVADNLNANKLLFPEPLILDYEAMREYKPPVMAATPEGGDPLEKDAQPGSRTFERADSALMFYDAAIKRLPSRVPLKRKA